MQQISGSQLELMGAGRRGAMALMLDTDAVATTRPACVVRVRVNGQREIPSTGETPHALSGSLRAPVCERQPVSGGL